MFKRELKIILVKNSQKYHLYNKQNLYESEIRKTPFAKFQSKSHMQERNTNKFFYTYDIVIFLQQTSPKKKLIGKARKTTIFIIACFANQISCKCDNYLIFTCKSVGKSRQRPGKRVIIMQVPALTLSALKRNLISTKTAVVQCGLRGKKKLSQFYEF